MPLYEYVCIEGCERREQAMRCVKDRNNELVVACKCDGAGAAGKLCRFRRVITPPGLTGLPTGKFHG